MIEGLGSGRRMLPPPSTPRPAEREGVASAAEARALRDHRERAPDPEPSAGSDDAGEAAQIALVEAFALLDEEESGCGEDEAETAPTAHAGAVAALILAEPALAVATQARIGAASVRQMAAADRVR